MTKKMGVSRVALAFGPIQSDRALVLAPASADITDCSRLTTKAYHNFSEGA